jgi:putative polyketide hydroxylase
MSPSASALPVLICGAGPVGLCASIELARYGIPSVVLERRASTSTHPKARLLNGRTMEILRAWGGSTHGALRMLDWPSRPWATRHVPSERTATARAPLNAPLDEEAFGGVEYPVLSSQDMFEPVFLAAARGSGLVDVQFNQQLLDIEQDESGVRLDVEDRGTGQRKSISAPYVLAADGASSSIRQALSLPMEGQHAIGHYINFYFQADLSRHFGNRPDGLYWIAKRDQLGVLQPVDGRSRWLCQIAYDGQTESRARFDNESCKDWVRRAVDDSALKLEALSVGDWTMSALVASQFRAGRVFLIGDAAQNMPPTGGFGLNTGIHGAHNLAWKLAYVLQGRAAPALLDTYEAERRPVSIETTAYALSIAQAVLESLEFASTGQVRRRRSTRRGPTKSAHDIERGYRYLSEAITFDVGDGSAGDASPHHGALQARPGDLAPHAWIQVNGQRRSTSELVGHGFTLLTSRGEAWLAAARTAGRALNLEITAYTADSRSPGFDHRYGLPCGGAVLVRPDGHICARWMAPPPSLAPALEGALRTALRLNPDAVVATFKPLRSSPCTSSSSAPAVPRVTTSSTEPSRRGIE